MHGQMNEQRRVLDGSAAGKHLAGEVDHHEIAGLDLRPMQAEGCEQESVRMPRYEHGHVVVDAFVHPEVVREPVARRKIDARLPLGLRCRGYGLEIRAHNHLAAAYGWPNLKTVAFPESLSERAAQRVHQTFI